MLNDLVNLFYPNNCGCCNNVLRKGESHICLFCLSDLPRTNYIKIKENPVAKLFWGRVDLTYGFSTYNFSKKGKIQDLIHLLKYKEKTEIGFVLGSEIGRDINDNIPPNTFDYIVPVPLHPKKQRLRGYNQSAFIAQGISSVCHVPVNEELVERVSNTVSQTKKNKHERWENVAEIFQLKNQEKIDGKHLLLVDDVVTTGATLESCARKFLEVPNSRVSVAVLASGF